MALIADGWHMASHAAAIGAAYLAYHFARRNERDPRFSFGTGKVLPLTGFASAVALGVVALGVGAESVARLVSGEPVTRIDHALVVAVLGLLVNLGSAVLLHGGEHDHGHGHGHGHGAGGAGDDPDHEDHNLRAAYFHVLADALTSGLAIVALLAAKLLGWYFLDPIMGIVGMLVVGKWSVDLIKGSASILLDQDVSGASADVTKALESIDDVTVADLHVWAVAPGKRAVVASVVTHSPREPASYQRAIAEAGSFHHISVEVHRCEPVSAAE